MTGALIMSTTLPTVVGMGVVARTTEIMFDKYGRRTTSKKKAVRRVRARVYKGSRGGKYVIRKGHRIYI